VDAGLDRERSGRRVNRARTAIPLVVVVLLGAWLAVVGEEDRSPARTGVVEKVEVELVLLDVLVLDRKGRTVPDLTLDDFDLYVGGRPVDIVSLDVDCAAGARPDPRAGQTETAAEHPDGETPVGNIIHAFDYYHLDLASRALEQARAAIRRHAAETYRQMIVAIGPGLRVEQPFTTDAAQLDRALERMERDPSLYAGNYARLTDRRFYDRLEALMDFLERIEGSKAVVLYSGPFVPDGFHHDPEFRRIASLAARARVSLYPVDSGGLRTPNGFVHGDLGGPKELARLAVETGGRVTYHTNDLGLALARAQRDLGCRYTIGFHDASPRPDQARPVRVWTRRSGLRMIYPVFYVVRSDERLLADRVRSARLVPEMFDSGGMRVAASPFRPRTPERWEVTVEVELPDLARAAGSTDPWHVDGSLRSPTGATMARFRHRLPAPAADGASPPRRLLERVSVKPGSYDLGVVMSRRGLRDPLAAHDRIDLPPIPADETLVVGPHLGRFASTVQASGVDEDDPGGRFEPLESRDARRGWTLEALTWVCRIGQTASTPRVRVERELTADSGRTVGTFDAETVELDRSGSMDCRALVDSIPTDGLEPGRYVLRAKGQARGLPGEVAFDVIP